MPRHRVKRNNAPFVLPSHLKGLLTGAGIALVIVLLLFLLRPASQVMASPEIATTTRLGVLRVGLLEEMPGFSQNGQGMEAALAAQLAREIFPGKEIAASLEITAVNGNTARARISSGEIDLALAMLEDTEESLYRCSRPYYADPVCLFTDSARIREPLETQTVGLVHETPAEDLLDAYNEEMGAALEAKPYASYPDLIDGLRKGAVDFAALPMSYARLFAMQGHARHVEPLGEIPYVAVCSADTPAYVELFDILLDEMEKTGRLSALWNQWGL